MTDSQSETRKSYRTRANSLCLAIFGTVFVLMLLYPFLSTVWWHIRHGNFTQSNGLRVPVPWRWQAYTDHGVIYLHKWPVILSVDRPFLASVTLAPIRNPPETKEQKEQFYETFANLYQTKLVPMQDAVEGPVRIGTRGEEGVCLQSVPANSKDWFHTTCLILQGTWSADFQGNPKDTKTVFTQILGLSEPTFRVP